MAGKSYISHKILWHWDNTYFGFLRGTLTCGKRRQPLCIPDLQLDLDLSPVLKVLYDFIILQHSQLSVLLEQVEESLDCLWMSVRHRLSNRHCTRPSVLPTHVHVQTACNQDQCVFQWHVSVFCTHNNTQLLTHQLRGQRIKTIWLSLKYSPRACEWNILWMVGEIKKLTKE